LVDRKRVLVLESEKLMPAGIASLLASCPELSVANTTVSSLACLSQLDDPRPDVVILEESVLATNISAVVKLADRHPTLRLIVFNTRDSSVHVFDKHIMQVRQVSDFLELL
jgi:DNA-binding NarL/FixJ family response regulator